MDDKMVVMDTFIQMQSLSSKYTLAAFFFLLFVVTFFLLMWRVEQVKKLKVLVARLQMRLQTIRREDELV